MPCGSAQAQSNPLISFRYLPRARAQTSATFVTFALQ